MARLRKTDRKVKDFWWRLIYKAKNLPEVTGFLASSLNRRLETRKEIKLESEGGDY